MGQNTPTGRGNDFPIILRISKNPKNTNLWRAGGEELQYLNPWPAPLESSWGSQGSATCAPKERLQIPMMQVCRLGSWRLAGLEESFIRK